MMASGRKTTIFIGWQAHRVYMYVIVHVNTIRFNGITNKWEVN